MKNYSPPPPAKNLLVACFILSFMPLSLLGQATSAFSIVSPYTELDADQTKIVNYATTNGIPGTLQYVNWATGDIVGSDGKIRITLPNENGGQQMVFDVVGSFIENSTTYAISGKNSLGQIALFSNSTGKMGTVILGTSTYDILPMSENSGIIFKKAPDASNEDQCTQIGEESTSQAYCSGDCGSSTIDILFMVTPEADQWLKDTYGIFSWLVLFSEAGKFNLALANSEIPNKQGRFRFIRYTAQDFVPSGIGEGNDALQRQLKESIHANQTLVDNGADIGVYLTPYFNHFGITGNHTVTGEPKFSVVQMTLGPILNMTIAHEIAHNFGCEHGYATPTDECTNGKLLTVIGSPTKGTIMAPAGSNRIVNYSNPNVPFMNGIMTGDDGSNGEAVRDNAARIKAAMCEVANNNTPTFFDANFTYDPYVIQDCEFYADAEIDPGSQEIGDFLIGCSGPYTYQWSWSIGLSGTYQNIGINSPSLYLTSPPICPTFYLKLKVSTQNGCQIEKIKMIKCLFNVPCPRSSSKAELKPEALFGKSYIVPNPATNRIKIVMAENHDVKDVSVINSMGKVLKGLQPILEDGELYLDIADLPNGIWMLKLESANTKTLLKFVISR